MRDSEERAAIMEYDGGLPRAEAEAKARKAIAKAQFLEQMARLDAGFRAKRVRMEEGEA